LAEYIFNGTNVVLTNVVQTEINSEPVAQSYGLASVNYLNNGNEVLFAGGPDGRIFSWVATNSTGPLQSQLFSSQYAGSSWHALTGMKTVEPGEGLIGLCVTPANRNICNVIFWSPQFSLQQMPNIVETAPSAVVLPSPNTLGSAAVVAIRIWDNEGDASTPFLQYQFFGSTNWTNATITTLDGSPYNSAVRGEASPDGMDHILTWNALTNVGGNVVTNILLRASAKDFMLTGTWSLPTPFQLNTTVTNPNPTNTPVNFTGVTLVQGGIQFDWQGSTNAWLYLQRSPALTGTNAVWTNIWTGIPPTPNFGSYTDFFGTNPMEFYRLNVVSP
jgi:hypothetical protein